MVIILEKDYSLKIESWVLTTPFRRVITLRRDTGFLSRSRSREVVVLSVLLVKVEVLGAQGFIGAFCWGQGPGRSWLYQCYSSRLMSRKVEVVLLLLIAVSLRLRSYPCCYPHKPKDSLVSRWRDFLCIFCRYGSIYVSKLSHISATRYQWEISPVDTDTDWSNYANLISTS